MSRRLKIAGVETTVSPVKGVTHAFPGTAAVVDKAVEAVEEAAAAVRSALGIDSQRTDREIQQSNRATRQGTWPGDLFAV